MAPWKGASWFFFALLSTSGAATCLLEVKEKAITQRFLAEGLGRIIIQPLDRCSLLSRNCALPENAPFLWDRWPQTPELQAPTLSLTSQLMVLPTLQAHPRPRQPLKPLIPAITTTCPSWVTKCLRRWSPSVQSSLRTLQALPRPPSTWDLGTLPRQPLPPLIQTRRLPGSPHIRRDLGLLLS